MCIQILGNVELSISAMFEYRHYSISARDPEVGDCVHVNPNIFGQIMICTFSPKYSMLVMSCKVRDYVHSVHSFVSKDTCCRL